MLKLKILCSEYSKDIEEQQEKIKALEEKIVVLKKKKNKEGVEHIYESTGGNFQLGKSSRTSISLVKSESNLL